MVADKIKIHIELNQKDICCYLTKSVKRLSLGSFVFTNLSSTMFSNVSPHRTNSSALTPGDTSSDTTSTLEVKWEDAKKESSPHLFS